MGGLGCPLLSYLGIFRIYNIGIADHDKVELSNLNRQILFSEADIGKYKVLSKKKIKRFIKELTLKLLKIKLL